MKRLFKIHKPYLIAIAVGSLLFMMFHWYATLERGYVALGGEMFLLFMPVLILHFVIDLMKDRRRRDEQEKAEERQLDNVA